MRLSSAVPILFILLSVHHPASAQTPVPAPDSVPIRFGQVLFTGYVQFDYLATGDEEAEIRDFRMRRVRLQLFGPLISGVRWAVSAEATDQPVLRDAYIILEFLPAATVPVGQLVMSYGFERFVASSNTLEFTERVLADLAPGRDAGIMVSNQRPFFGWLSYGAAIVNGTGQNTPDNNVAKDLMLRVAASPRRAAGLHVGVNVMQGEQPDGRRTRIGGDVRFEGRSYHFGGELLREQRERGAAEQDGFYAFGSWRIYPAVPRRAFHHLELAARYARLAGDVTDLRQWDFAVNYYVHRGLRFMFDLVVPEGPDAGYDGAVLHTRANFRF